MSAFVDSQRSKLTHSFTQSCWGLCQRTHHPRLPPPTSVSSCLIPLVTHSTIRLQSVSSLCMCCTSKSWSEDTLQVCPTMDLLTTTMWACSSSSSSSIMAVALMARSSYQMVLRRWSPHKHFQVPSEFMLHIGHCTSDTRYDQTIYIPWHHSSCCSELKGFGWKQYMKVKDRIATDFTSIIFEVMVLSKLQLLLKQSENKKEPAKPKICWENLLNLNFQERLYMWFKLSNLESWHKGFVNILRDQA